jgi:hypothetical protein
MASDLLTLTVQIIASHASMTALTSKELVREIKEVHSVLTSLIAEECVPEAEAKVVPPRRKVRAVKIVESPLAKAIEDEEKEPVGDPDYLEFMESREG